MAGVILDGFIAVLLLITIGYCWKLSRKIVMLHEGRAELNIFIQSFNAAIARAEGNIAELKELSGEADDKLKEHIQKARFLANDLSFLMDKGDNMADMLEHYISASKNIRTRPATTGAVERKYTKAKNNQLVSKEQIEPMTPAPNIPKPQNNPPVTPKNTNVNNNINMNHSKKRALDDVLSQISARKVASKQKTVNNNKKSTVTNNSDLRERVLGGGKVFDQKRIVDTLKADQGVDS